MPDTTFMEALAALSPFALLSLIILFGIWLTARGILPALSAQTKAQQTSNQQLLIIRQSYGELIERMESVSKREMDEMREDLRDQQQKNEAMAAKIAAVTTEAATLRVRVTKLEEENADLKKQLEQVEADREKTAAERDSAQEKVQKLEEEVETLKGRVDALKKELEDERSGKAGDALRPTEEGKKEN